MKNGRFIIWHTLNYTTHIKLNYKIILKNPTKYLTKNCVLFLLSDPTRNILITLHTKRL